MTDHASATRREFLSAVRQVSLGVSALAVGGAVIGRSGAATATGQDGARGLSVAAVGREPAERARLSGPIAFPFTKFAPGDLVCLNNFGTCRRRHEGVDIGELRPLEPRVPLVSCVDGVITQRDDVAHDRPGRFVVIHGEDGRWYRYHHLDEIADHVEVGASVRVGSALGTMGSTGNTSWPHLHFEVWVGDGAHRGAGRAIDPVPLLAIPGTVQLRARDCV